ncbi:Hypothetical protein NTJ_13393 [Nesidiocoris tenuis]|uniref:Uncharacterized protein n=1 Tax=Nesidiocoris tenuis TaxID=355587 RepID=A0ABN7BBR2_9HEMI|nr:Hypothetical protein NTJ_13393 [Nesidiocoris tenuis]
MWEATSIRSREHVCASEASCGSSICQLRQCAGVLYNIVCAYVFHYVRVRISEEKNPPLPNNGRLRFSLGDCRGFISKQEMKSDKFSKLDKLLTLPLAFRALPFYQILGFDVKS